MRPLFSSCALLLLLAALEARAVPIDNKVPASDNKGKIEGTRWMSLPTKYQGMDLPAGLLQLEFGKDGKLIYRAGEITHTGTYKLAAGKIVELHLDKPLAGLKVHKESVVIKGDRLTMTDSDGTSLTFQPLK